MKHTFILKIDAVLSNLLSTEMRRQRLSHFRDFVASFVTEQLGKLKGLVEACSVSQERIRVTWVQREQAPQPLDEIIAMLQRGELVPAILLLELFLSESPDDTIILYNLGMAYSDKGLLDRALVRLRHLLELDPKHVNGRIALGVALMRQGNDDDALPELRHAAKDDPSNPWAQRNLGGCLFKLGQAAEAVVPLRKAAELNPEDERAWYGLGQALEISGDEAGADEAYIRSINANEYGDVAELARTARSKIAQRAFRAVTPAVERMDAVMYCLSALQKFASMPPAEVQRIGFEIAILGTKGIDVNDPVPKYHLRSLPGKFSGLHLLSLMYVAFRQIAPGQNVSFDLSAEYQAALALHQRPSGGE